MNVRMIRSRPGVLVTGALCIPRPQAEARPAVLQLRIIRPWPGVLPRSGDRQPRCNAVRRRPGLRVACVGGVGTRTRIVVLRC
jgi:hypothetical protein